ncbi:hypothetical protein RI367_005573 [Sorochytrium milnesiophthora]
MDHLPKSSSSSSVSSMQQRVGANVTAGASSPMQCDSPSQEPRKFSKIVTELGKKLSRRSDKDELVNKNIIQDAKSDDEAAEEKQEKEAEIEKLNQRLQRRPSKTDLKLRNIIRVNSTDSLPGTEGAPHAPVPSFQQRSKELRSCLKVRPERTELEQKNILRGGDGVDPSLVSAADALKRAQLTDMLNTQIAQRPAPEDMSKKFIGFVETVEILPTFRKGEYNRKPDANATFKKLTPRLKMEIREELNAFKKSEMPVHQESQSNTAFH